VARSILCRVRAPVGVVGLNEFAQLHACSWPLTSPVSLDSHCPRLHHAPSPSAFGLARCTSRWQQRGPEHAAHRFSSKRAEIVVFRFHHTQRKPILYTSTSRTRKVTALGPNDMIVDLTNSLPNAGDLKFLPWITHMLGNLTAVCASPEINSAQSLCAYQQQETSKTEKNEQSAEEDAGEKNKQNAEEDAGGSGGAKRKRGWEGEQNQRAGCPDGRVPATPPAARAVPEMAMSSLSAIHGWLPTHALIDGCQSCFAHSNAPKNTAYADASTTAS
jgi:hypothetical protein